MKKSRFRERQIAFILKQADDGFSVDDVAYQAEVVLLEPVRVEDLLVSDGSQPAHNANL